MFCLSDKVFITKFSYNIKNAHKLKNLKFMALFELPMVEFAN
jgi:hypothetical protein